MKLYTEEQVKTMLNRARIHKWDDAEMFTNEYLISAETPIELPSDEEITEEFKYHSENWELRQAIEYGAKWMRDKILNK